MAERKYGIETQRVSSVVKQEKIDPNTRQKKIFFSILLMGDVGKYTQIEKLSAENINGVPEKGMYMRKAMTAYETSKYRWLIVQQDGRVQARK